jgi:LemA protein
MKKNRGLLFLLAGLALIIGIFLFTTYNSLVKKEERVKRDWGNLNTTYQRRNDLIPSLVAVVKGAAQYETNVFTQVAEARAKAANLSFSGAVSFQDYQQLEQAQGELTNSVNQALGTVENYPNLKATRNFTLLQSQLEGTERRIKVARKDFNASVAEYNNGVRRFPGNIVAGMFGFRPREGFQAEIGASQAPEINFKK